MKIRNLIKLAVAATAGLALAAPAAAEVDELKMMSQYGIGYMQLTVMKHDKLVEKHLAAAGLPNTKVSWTKLGAGDITAQFTSPPFYQRALEDKAIHKVLDSYEIMGEPNTFLMVWATKKFRDDNPKSYRAILAALKEATAAINADKRRAAEIYSKEGGGKESVDKLLKIMDDPQIRFTVAPEGILPFAQFMHDVERIKNRPASWKDLFFPDIHNLQGS